MAPRPKRCPSSGPCVRAEASAPGAQAAQRGASSTASICCSSAGLRTAAPGQQLGEVVGDGLFRMDVVAGVAAEPRGVGRQLRRRVPDRLAVAQHRQGRSARGRRHLEQADVHHAEDVLARPELGAPRHQQRHQQGVAAVDRQAHRMPVERRVGVGDARRQPGRGPLQRLDRLEADGRVQPVRQRRIVTRDDVEQLVGDQERRRDLRSSPTAVPASAGRSRCPGCRARWRRRGRRC